MDLKKRIIKAKRKIFDRAFNKLNDKQREAVFLTKGPLLVLAGAGSGKTTVLVKRIAFMIKYGNAYFDEEVPENMLFEEFAQKLESIAENQNEDKALIESTMSVFAKEPAFPYQILAITFTNKAANEIKQRLSDTLGDTALDIWAGTFHSICAKILRMHIERIGISSSFTIYDTDDQKRLMKEIVKENSINDKTFPPKSVLNEISRAKEKLMDCQAYDESVNSHDIRRKTISRLYREYEKRKKSANALDFDDLIMLTVKLLNTDEELCEKYRRRFKYILVDEYQDTNIAQSELIKKLCNKDLNLMVVGDDDQSIYKFRGATVDNILSFDTTYKDTKVVKLEQNYRSTGYIVKAANSVIENNKGRKGKTLWTGNGDGEKIVIKRCEHQGSEAQSIVNQISEMVASGEYKFEDFAILYRMNAQSAGLETVFAKSGIPYRIIGGLRFYERKEIKDVIAYLCVIANPSDNLRLKRIINVPKRGIGEATIDELERIAGLEGIDMLTCAENALSYPSLARNAGKLMKFAGIMKELREGYKEQSIGVFVEKVIEKTGYLDALAALDEAESKDRTANVKELVSNAVQYENTTPDASIESFLEEIALVSDIDNYDTEANAVVMMTVHSAKGLEFPVVFLPGMEEGVFPGNQTIMEADEEMEEERRLAYVAITRAKKRLFILHCRSRMVFGRTEYHEKSRFVKEISEEYIEQEDIRSDLWYDTGAGNFEKNTAFRRNVIEKKPANDAYAYNKAREISQRNKQSKESNIQTFSIGNRVLHSVFGEGTVIGVRPMGADTLYEIAFDSVGTKKIMGNYAKMTKA